MKLFKYTFLAFSALLIVGCSGSKEVAQSGSIPQMNNDELIRSNEVLDGAPIWSSMPPADDENYLYTVNQATGSTFTQQATLLSAENLARQAMAAKIEAKVQALQKSFLETVTSADQQNYDATFTNVNKITTDETLNNTTSVRNRCMPIAVGDRPSGNVDQRCFVIMRMPIGPAKAAYENALSKDEELYTKFKASKAYQELQDEFSNVGND
tara:strand:- start:21157 stop:21789 length:633 start_codon:yes stop_codon:yes gene_type:complete